MPKRIQCKRTKGWRLPAGAVYVGRPTKWGNPYKIGKSGVVNAKHATWLFRQAIDRGYAIVNRRPVRVCSLAEIGRLCGKDLACWCPLDQPCHADVLLELADKA